MILDTDVRSTRRPRWFEVCDLAYTVDQRVDRFRARDPEPWEIEIMELLAYQGAVPLDQFARFLSYDEDRANQAAECLRERGFVDVHDFFPDEPPWLGLTRHGARMSGTGLSWLEIAPGSCARTRAVNEVRLLWAEKDPDADWVSRRQLVRLPRAPRKLPNAAVLAGEERYSIDVRISPHNLELLEPMLDLRLQQRFHAALCFCIPRVYDFLKEVESRRDWSKVRIYRLPRGIADAA